MNTLLDEFRSPGAAWRGKPFWSWNGDLQEEELLRQVHILQKMGMGGFFMHSRTGLATQYLGDEWFRLTNACADEAQRLGLEAWLYDEDRWPSGTAGGMVTENPAHQMTFLRLRCVPISEFVWCDCLVAAFSCRLDGTAYVDCTQLSSHTSLPADSSLTILTFTVETMEPSSFYNGQTYVNTLSREATEQYIALTHARYKQHCGDHFGTAIQGIFTDEPHRGAVMTGFGLPNADRLWMTPWTEALPTWFQERFGQDLIAHLPELFLYAQGEAVSPIKWQYMELLQQMFLENFVKPLYGWCEANHLRLTGHALHEDNLTAQAAMQGSLMRFYEYQHDPGVDVLTEGNRNPRIIKPLVSAARQLGKPWRLSELYGCTGWQMNFRSHKEVGDWQALLGINLRCHHLSWYTMEGEAKRDYPGSILHQSAWWQDYSTIETYFARLGLLLAQGEPACDLLVLNPIESVWCQIGIGWAKGLSAKAPALQNLEQGYAELSDWLLHAHLDYDYGDEEMMSRLAHITKDADGSPRFVVGRMMYRAVLVPRMTTLRSTTLMLLHKFAEAGGAVLFAGHPPTHVDALPSAAPATLAASCLQIPWEADSLQAACRQAVPAETEIVDAKSGENLPEIFCQVRRDGKRRVLVALNMNRERDWPHVRIRLRGEGAVEEWDCRSGARWAVSAHCQNGWTEFITHFAASGERAYVLTPEPDLELTARPCFTKAGSAVSEGPYAYTLREDNVCVLDFARWRLNDDEWQAHQEILKVDQAVRDALGLPRRSGEMVQPWFQRKHQPPPPLLATLTVEFRFIANDIPDTIRLAMERPEQWSVFLNDVPLSSEVQGWWVDTAFSQLRLPMMAFQQGENILRLETNFHANINLEALYLLGGFGVYLEGTRPTLGRLPERLSAGDIVPQGFPFYGGLLTYHLALPQYPADARLRLETPTFAAACVKVQGHLIAFPPLHAGFTPFAETLDVDVILTRRNTFGPLHQIPVCTPSYAPGNFVTEGEAFSQEYQLHPAGLLEPPTIGWSAAAE